MYLHVHGQVKCIYAMPCIRHAYACIMHVHCHAMYAVMYVYERVGMTMYVYVRTCMHMYVICDLYTVCIKTEYVCICMYHVCVRKRGCIPMYT